MPTRFTSLLILCLTAGMSLLLVGCGVGSKSGNSAETLYSTGAHGRKYTLSFLHPPKARKKLRVNLKIVSPNQSAASIQKVWVTGSMPGMVMPPMKDSLHQLKDGTYSGTLLFVMSGKWDLKIHAATKNQQLTDDFLFHVKN